MMGPSPPTLREPPSVTEESTPLDPRSDPSRSEDDRRGDSPGGAEGPTAADAAADAAPAPAAHPLPPDGESAPGSASPDDTAPAATTPPAGEETRPTGAGQETGADAAGDYPREALPSPETAAAAAGDAAQAPPVAETGEGAASVESPPGAAAPAADAPDTPGPEGAAPADGSPATPTAVEGPGAPESAGAAADDSTTTVGPVAEPGVASTDAQIGAEPPAATEGTVTAEPVEAPAPPVELVVGAVVRGTIREMGDDEAVIALPGERTGRARKTDLANEYGKIVANPGDAFDLVVVQAGEEPWLKRRVGRRRIAVARLAEKYEAKTPVDARVTAAIKGGFEVRVEGVRAFCPASQAGLARDESPEALVGKTLPFLVTKFDPKGRSIVVSRRKLLDRDRRKLAGETKTKITKGARLTGRVVGLQPYGAFVDLGGLQGLLHVSELSHQRIGHPEEALAIGQEVDVVVLKHDTGMKKISLSRKALLDDPWSSLDETLQPGLVVSGRVVRTVPFGAFVEIRPGIEGLLPTREAEPAATAGEAAADATPGVGDETVAQVVELDRRRRRLTLGEAPADATPGQVIEPPKIEAGARIEGTVERIAPFGVFVRLAPGRTGLLHASETGTAPGTDLERSFPAGSRLTVEILETADDGRRIRLTCRTAEQRKADARRREAREGPPRGEGGPPRRGRRGRAGDRPSEKIHNPAAAPSSGFASLGDFYQRQLERDKPVDDEDE